MRLPRRKVIATETVPTPDDEPIPVRFRPLIAGVAARLAAGDYEGIVADGLVREGHHDFALFVREYPASLVPLPPEAWVTEQANAIPLNDGSGWAFVIDLYTKEEGRSDLSMEGLLFDDDNGPRLLIHNIHVL